MQLLLNNITNVSILLKITALCQVLNSCLLHVFMSFKLKQNMKKYTFVKDVFKMYIHQQMAEKRTFNSPFLDFF